MNEQNVDGGYDFKVVKEGNDLECPICLLLLREAMGTHCRHLLCKVCLEKLQRSSDDNERDLICPTCKEKIGVNQVHPNFYVDGQVTGSDVYCLQQDSGCQWAGTLAAYLRDHHEKCDHVIVSCDNIGCGDKLARNLMNEHAVKCPHRLVNCVYCQMEVKFNQLYEYHYTECQKIPVDCLMGCGVQVPREKMEEHLDKVCGLAEVECEFSNVGCTAKVPRMNLKKHLVEFTQIHMSHLCNILNQSQKEMEQLKRTSALSQKKVEQLENGKSQSDKDLEEMKRINAKSQNEIKQMNIQIEELKEAYNQSQNEIKQIKETSNQSQNEIEQLKIANTQLQHKIQQLNKTIQMGPFASTGLESEMMEN